MSIFVLDTNIFVEASQRYYSFDIAPTFWHVLKEKAECGLLISVDRVFEEINKYANNDELKRWANNDFRSFFKSTDCETVFDSYKEIINWAVNQNQFIDSAKGEFASVADSWLLAFAKAYNYTIVTHEKYDPFVKRKIPIPNVCRNFNIPYIDTFKMLRELNFKFK